MLWQVGTNAVLRNLDQAELNVRYCDVVSEIDGVVVRRSVNPGTNVVTGQELLIVRSLTDDELVLAQSWGLAIRLAQRLSGGTEDPLENSRLSLTPGVVRLVVSPCQADLVSDQVNRRLKVLATVMGRKPEITIDAIRDD